MSISTLIPLRVASILSSVGRPAGWPFLLLFAVVAAICADEGFRMFLHGARDRAGGVALAVLVFFSAALLPGSFGVPALLVCVLLSVFHALPGAFDPAEKARRAATFCLGAVYVGGLLSMYPRTLLLPRGEHWVLLGILAVAAGDTMAYFTGRAIGRRKLAPAISPNKTVEGAVGGLLGSVGCAVLYAHGFLPGVPAGYAAAAGAAVGIFGQAGDLFESLIKRTAGVKDSGTILPGHGGILDRADGILAAGPVLYLFAALSPLAGGSA
ncbi:phosphatidate cytidylyltransferase [Candidatus Deferrimicrobium sp.]|uniref:phosphatidate cytidylyltransferase n=1 Tax=Candidatus Deferrimicrobium sp. TaxID=3060586 RepID=UPI002724F7E8|nr:phosphatidate cytidylyltransferase [Candidatus Deferrimicrobium sp.]MDO8738013.1 phosphatidate cytidylyltransferase [Candidatus Deferrimicrobium sp.]